MSAQQSSNTAQGSNHRKAGSERPEGSKTSFNTGPQKSLPSASVQNQSQPPNPQQAAPSHQQDRSRSRSPWKSDWTNPPTPLTQDGRAFLTALYALEKEERFGASKGLRSTLTQFSKDLGGETSDVRSQLITRWKDLVKR